MHDLGGSWTEERMKRRPRLTAKIVEGLNDARCVLSAELEAGPDGAFGSENGGPDDGGACVVSALKYIDDLIEWYWFKHPEV